MTKVFMDAGYIIALEALDDQHHRAASTHWREFSRLQPTLLTTSYVLTEVVAFFNNRRRSAKAVEIGSRILGSPSVHFIHVDRELFESGWEYFQRHEHKQYPLTDCISFVLMDQQGIREALTFNLHFEEAGYRRMP